MQAGVVKTRNAGILRNMAEYHRIQWIPMVAMRLFINMIDFWINAWWYKKALIQKSNAKIKASLS
jgi:hypothetical protein